MSLDKMEGEYNYQMLSKATSSNEYNIKTLFDADQTHICAFLVCSIVYIIMLYISGDQVLEWNGVTLTGKTYEEVQQVISAPNGEIELVVRPYVHIILGHVK